MRWQGRRGSGNIQDRRGRGGGGVAVGGVGGLGLLAIVVVGWFFGVDLTPMLNGTTTTQPSGPPRELTEAEKEAGEFVSVVLADTEEVWAAIFPEQVGEAYRPAQMVLYSGGDQSACGYANAAVGPFYCPNDETVYLDTDFFGLMQERLGAGGDFAFAYVVAHEIGHHVQKQLGILDWSMQQRQTLPEAEANEVSVRVELMADCLAGIFARAEADKGYLERGDVDEAMAAAEAIGDDTLQRNAGQHPVPDSFTHGSSEQRMRWFDTGYDSGSVASCNTIEASDL